MLIDIHIHESKYSDDSKMTLKEVVIAAKAKGLDGICITNHGNNDLMQEAHDFAKENDFIIIVGAEIYTLEGDILVFTTEKMRIADKTIHAEELFDIVEKQNGVTISAHPFRNNNRGLGEYIRNVTSNLSAIEAFNGSTLPHHNLTAFAIAKEFGIPCTGASDAHVLEKVGTFATYFETDIRNEIVLKL